MKLLHVTATHLKPDGGVPVVLKNLVSEQNKIENFRVKVISLVAPVDEMDSPYFEYVGISNFEKKIDEFCPDLVILHSFYYIVYNHVVHILNKKNIRYYIEPHGSFGKAALNKSKIKKIIANNTVFKSQLSNAYGFIFLNEAERKDSKYQTKNDVIIPNGMSFHSKTVKLKQQRKENTIYFIGRYDIEHKGLDYLLDAMDELEKQKYYINLYLWGKGTNRTIKYLTNRCKDYKYVNVIISKSIYGEKKDLILEQFGPMILTSRYEGFPMTILEAWRYGNPCIVTPGTNMFEEIQNENLGWGTGIDGKEIAEVLKVALRDYEKNREIYIKRCKKYLEMNYSWDKIARKSYKILSMKSKELRK